MHAKTMKGKPIDFTKYVTEHGDKAAIGNASMNARGDIIDRKGNVVRTRADISHEYHVNRSKSVKHVPIKAVDTTVFETPSEALQRAQNAAKKQAATKAAEERRPRKITEEE